MKSFKDFLNGIVEEKTGYKKFFEKCVFDKPFVSGYLHYDNILPSAYFLGT